MEWLSARTILWLKPLALSYSIIRFLNFLGGCYLSRLLFDQSYATSSYMIKSLILSFFLTNLSFAFPLVSALSIFLLPGKTSSQPKSRSLSSLVITATLLIHINTLSLPMAPFLRTLLCSQPPPPPPPSQFWCPISTPFFPIPDSSSTPPATPQPLQVYTRRPHTDIRPPPNSSPIVSSSTTSVLLSPDDLPIVIQKGNRSSRNHHPIYNFLTYHRLFSPYSTFISTLSFCFSS